MKHLLPSPSASLLFGLAAVLSAGCATRPPRQMGPPKEPVMPPAVLQPRDVDTTLPSEPILIDQGLPEVRPPQLSTPDMPPAPAPVQPRKGTPYTIRKGESLSAIAARNKMSWVKLAEYNYITNPNTVRAGQVILIPDDSAPAPVASSTPPRVAPPAAPANTSGKTYVVKAGDSLSVVAQRYGTSVKELKSVNGMNSDRLLVGQILKLPSGASGSAPESREINPSRPEPTPAPARPAPTPVPQVEDIEMESPVRSVDPVVPQPETTLDTKAFPVIVQEGDTIQSIADSYVVLEEEIRKLNNLGPNEEVKTGQKLKVPSSSVY